MTITIDSSSYNGKECYLVSASSNGAVDNIPGNALLLRGRMAVRTEYYQSNLTNLDMNYNLHLEVVMFTPLSLQWVLTSQRM